MLNAVMNEPKGLFLSKGDRKSASLNVVVIILRALSKGCSHERKKKNVPLRLPKKIILGE